jgi:hypothetical protein
MEIDSQRRKKRPIGSSKGRKSNQSGSQRSKAAAALLLVSPDRELTAIRLRTEALIWNEAGSQVAAMGRVTTVRRIDRPWSNCQSLPGHVLKSIIAALGSCCSWNVEMTPLACAQPAVAFPSANCSPIRPPRNATWGKETLRLFYTISSPSVPARFFSTLLESPIGPVLNPN